jgi:hypothetical protein
MAVLLLLPQVALGAALHIVTSLSQLVMMARRPPCRHILFCHNAQRGMRRPPWPPCLGPYRVQTMQCWSTGQSGMGAPLRVTRATAVLWGAIISML